MYDHFWVFCLTVVIFKQSKLQTVVVLWPLFGLVTFDSKQWQFYGNFSGLSNSDHKTANLGSPMATFRNLQNVAMRLLGLAVLRLQLVIDLSRIAVVEYFAAIGVPPSVEVWPIS